MRENARFTHVMTNFGCDVRGKRFSTHAAVAVLGQGENPVFRITKKYVPLDR